MRNILKLNLRSGRVCFKIETEACCGETITQPDRFKLEIHKQSYNDTTALITYQGLEAGTDGELCWEIDDNMRELCAGRYIARFVLDDCINIRDIKFKWGSVPKITETTVEAGEDQTIDQMPITCCPECGLDETDGYDCGSCCTRCDCPPTFEDPTALVNRSC